MSADPDPDRESGSDADADAGSESGAESESSALADAATGDGQRATETGAEAEADVDGTNDGSNSGTGSTADDDTDAFVWDGSVAADPGESPDETAAAGGGQRARLAPERYLFAGERVVQQESLDPGWVAVTTHRLLVFDPDAEGRRFEAVDRLNVVGVTATAGGSPRARSLLPRVAAYAVVLLSCGLAGRAVGLRSLFSSVPETSGAPGVDGLLSVVGLVGSLLGGLVDLLVVAGVVAGLVAVSLVAWDVRDRTPTLVVERAGDDDIRVELPTASSGRDVVDGIEWALADELAAVESGA
jgi:hypothetical protein